MICVKNYNYQSYYHLTLIPTCLFLVLHLSLDFWYTKRIHVIPPFKYLMKDRKRIYYVFTFGALGNTFLRFLHSKTIISIDGINVWYLRPLLSFMLVMEIGLIYYPVFACFCSRYVLFSRVYGIIHIVLLMLQDLYQILYASCGENDLVSGMNLGLTMPGLIFNLVVVICFSIDIVCCFKQQVFIEVDKKDMANSHQIAYVRGLFTENKDNGTPKNRPAYSEIHEENKIVQHEQIILFKNFQKYVWRSHPNFRYSSVILGALLVIYQAYFGLVYFAFMLIKLQNFISINPQNSSGYERLMQVQTVFSTTLNISCEDANIASIEKKGIHTLQNVTLLSDLQKLFPALHNITEDMKLKKIATGLLKFYSIICEYTANIPASTQSSERIVRISLHICSASILITVIFFMGQTLRFLVCHRDNMLKMYKADRLLKEYSKKADVGTAYMFLSYQRFSGNTIVKYYVSFLGYFIAFNAMGLIFFLVIILTLVILVYSIATSLLVFFKVVKLLYNVVFTALIFMIVQFIFIKFVFTKKKRRNTEENDSHWMSNLLIYHILIYFMLFGNLLTGLWSSLLTTLLDILVQMANLGRLDYSILNTAYFLCIDRGHRAYLGFLKIQSVYTNPTVRCFCQILMENNTDFFERKFNYQRSRISRKARNRWHLVVTLINNASLCQLRRQSGTGTKDFQENFISHAPDN